MPTVSSRTELLDALSSDGAYSLNLAAYGGANRSGAVLGTDTFDFTLKEAGSGDG